MQLLCNLPISSRLDFSLKRTNLNQLSGPRWYPGGYCEAPPRERTDSFMLLGVALVTRPAIQPHDFSRNLLVGWVRLSPKVIHGWYGKRTLARTMRSGGDSSKMLAKLATHIKRLLNAEQKRLNGDTHPAGLIARPVRVRSQLFESNVASGPTVLSKRPRVSQRGKHGRGWGRRVGWLVGSSKKLPPKRGLPDHRTGCSSFEKGCLSFGTLTLLRILFAEEQWTF